jgi:hypothetical protein
MAGGVARVLLYHGWEQLKFSPTTSEPKLKGITVNILKNMEVIFVVVLAAVGTGSFLLDYLPNAEAKPQAPIAHNIATPTSMAVVIIKGPRGGV